MPERMILCIDDEDMGLQIRKVVLERAGYRVTTASSGPAGLEIFANSPVDLVILDYAMPTMHGGLVAAEIRRQRPNVPIILLSAYVNLPREVADVVDCTIVKGDNPETLLTRIRELLCS